MTKFADAIDDFVLAVDQANENVVKSVTIAVFRNIIFASPVGTLAGETSASNGRFRANWFLGGAVPSSSSTESTDKSGSLTVNKMAAGVQAFDGLPEGFTLTNNLPYSEVIEFGDYPNPVKLGTKTSKKGTKPAKYEKRSSGGYSKQAPQGVVRVNMKDAERLLEEEAKKAGYGSI